MKHTLKFLFATILLTFSLHGFSAVSVVECEDQQGGRSFQKSCPPGSTQVGSKKVNTGNSASGKKKVDIKATLYVIPDCSECDEVKEYLQSKDVSLNVKNANESIEIQDELTEISGGLKVPTAVINGEVVVGYQRSKIKAILAKLGGEETKPSPDKQD